MPHPLLRSQFGKQAHVVDRPVIDLQVADAEVMERREHVLLEGVLQGDAEGDHVVEQAVYVIAIGSRGRCRHPQEKRWFEVGKDRLVAVRTRPVRFVDDDVVEFP